MFCPITTSKLSPNSLNFHWRWRWWDRIQVIFLNLFYFTIQGRRKVWKSGGGHVILGGDNVPPLAEIGLTDLPKSGGGVRAPPAPHLRRACLCIAFHLVSILTYAMLYKFEYTKVQFLLKSVNFKHWRTLKIHGTCLDAETTLEWGWDRVGFSTPTGSTIRFWHKVSGSGG